MNRYGRPPGTNTSKATATTLCQKCLKRGHYSYECKSAAQDRPYVSRPSRTQQLLNPRLMPKLTSEVPQELLRKKGIADEQLAKAEQERGRKRERTSEERDIGGAPKRMRSTSVSSVSTISTNLSRSHSPPPLQRTHVSQGQPRNTRARPRSRTPPSRHSFSNRSRSYNESLSPEPRRQIKDPERKRRRSSVSSVDTYTSGEVRNSRERTNSRNTRRRYQQHSPPDRGRRTESRSPYRGRRGLSDDRTGGRNTVVSERKPLAQAKEVPPPRKERSLSPFSKRLALTQAMNAGR